VETSDTDIKGIYVLDSLDDYMRVPEKPTINTQNGAEGPDKIENEMYYIQRFAQLLSSSATNLVSMVFAPRDKWLVTSPAWEELVENRGKLVSKNLPAYVSYAQSMSQRYTLKGERLTTAQEFLDYIRATLPDYGGLQNGKMNDAQWEILVKEFVGREGCDLWVNPTGETLIRIAGKSFSKTTRVEGWIEPMENLIKTYGKRARKSQQDGQDLKAILHAFRIANEAKELLETGQIVYPTPRRQFYLDIRANKFSYEELQEWMLQELENLNQKIKASTLPEYPDGEFLRAWGIRWQQRYWGNWFQRKWYGI
jgi:predicted nucleotidyltransferase